MASIPPLSRSRSPLDLHISRSRVTRVAGADGKRSGNPAVRASADAPAGQADASGSLRKAINDRSRPVLARLARLPRLFIPLGVLVLMVLGLSAPVAVALPAFAILAAFVGWLAYLSWPALDTGGRLVRIGMLAVVIGSAVAQGTGWL
jgi:Family of unknown function (DUF6703)